MSWMFAKKECMKTYETDNKKLEALLKPTKKVYITDDMWTSCQKLLYMVMACHFINTDWNPQVMHWTFVIYHLHLLAYLLSIVYKSIFNDIGELRIKLVYLLLTMQVLIWGCH